MLELILFSSQIFTRTLETIPNPSIIGAQLDVRQMASSVYVTYMPKTNSERRVKWSFSLLSDEEYLQSQIPYLPSFGVRVVSNSPIVFVLTEMESGVYGYKRLRFFRVLSDRAVQTSVLPEFEYSDFGSWSLSKDGRLLLWDAFYEPKKSAHEEAHRYRIVSARLKERGWIRSSTVVTKGKYNPGWNESGSRPKAISKRNDPLSELFLSWKWWPGTDYSIR